MSAPMVLAQQPYPPHPRPMRYCMHIRDITSQLSCASDALAGSANPVALQALPTLLTTIH